MTIWRNLESRFDYEVAIGTSVADRDRIMEIVRELDPKVTWIRVDGQYVICSNQSRSAIAAMLITGDSELRKSKQ